MSRSVEARLRDVAGPEIVDRIAHLESVAIRPLVDADLPPPDPQATTDFDVAMAGGGLWVTLAPLLAGLGLRVVVIERARAASAHREWNASLAELGVLVRHGLFGRDELDRCVVTTYERGICRFHGYGPHAVRGVLDHALDATAFLAHVRVTAERRGVTFLDGHTVDAVGAGAARVRLRATPRAGGPSRDLVASVMVDARGVASPYATADLVCPTVGGVLAGLVHGDGPDEVDPAVGEILVTTEGIEDGRQHVWEGFPGRTGELTTYLFYYARRDEPQSLFRLYERFFDSVGRYKRGEARLVRPTFGFIPGWSRVGPPPRSPSPRIVLVGDAAARHSALTYCGFGSMLRRLEGVAADVERIVQVGGGASAHERDEATHALTGSLSLLLASRRYRGDALNRLLDAAFAEIEAMGNDAYAALLQDRLPPRAVARFLLRTASRHPSVWRETARALGPVPLTRWMHRVLVSAAADRP